MALTKTKSALDAIFTHAASAEIIEGATASIADAYHAELYVYFSPGSATATTVVGEARVEVSSSTSGDTDWMPHVTLSMASVATAADEALTATEPAAETVIAVAATAGITAGLPIFIRNTTLASSEWHEVKSIVANTSVTLVDGLANEQTAAASTIYTLADRRKVTLPFGANRVRVVFLAPTGPTTAVWKTDLLKVTAV